MQPRISQQEATFMQEAIAEAEAAERNGNLPIGAVVVFDGKVVSKAGNAIWNPVLAYTRHAEMEALRSVPLHLWSRSRALALYTTLEPCLMCAGAILLHRLARVVFGSTDPFGGASTCFGSLPPYFGEQLHQVEWIGPAAPAQCDPLYTRVMGLLQKRSAGSASLFPDA